MLSSRWPTKSELCGLEFPCLIVLCLGSSIFLILLSILLYFLLSFYPTGPLLIYYDFQFHIYMGFLSVQMNRSLCFVPFLGFFPCVCFLLYIIILYLLSHRSPCFLMRDRKVVGGSRWERRSRRTGCYGEKGNYNQDILCEEKIYILYKRRKS